MTTAQDPDPTDVLRDNVLARLTELGEQHAAIRAEIRSLVETYVATSAEFDPARPVSQAAASRAAKVDRNAIRDYLGLRRRTADAPGRRRSNRLR